MLTATIYRSGHDFVHRRIRNERLAKVVFIDRCAVKSTPKQDWDRPGVYVLIGSPSAGGVTPVFVSKANSLRSRLSQHRVTPPIDWNRAVAVARDTTDGFHSAQVGYFEGRLANQLRTEAQIEG